jgi:hypothetical protein
MNPRDPKEGLSPEALRLLRGAQGPRRRTEAERHRTAARVARIGVVPLVAGSVWLSWKGAVLGAALLVAGGVAVVAQKRAVAPSETPASSAVVARPVSRPALPLATPTPARPETQTLAVVPAPPAPAPSPTPVRARVIARRPAPVMDTPVMETPPPPPAVTAPAPTVPAASAAATPAPALSPLEALEQARRLLRSDPAAALQTADRVTTGGVDEERERIAIDALHRLGRRDAMRARSEAFLQRYPRSLYGERIRSLLASP